MDNQPNPKGYGHSLNIHGNSPKSLQWNNYRSAAIRYRQLLYQLEIDNKYILDVGCGTGDFLPYLYAKSANFQYLGVDINPEFIKIANKRYEGNEFKVLNPFKDDLGQTFDIVILCGALNANKEGWLESRKQKITRLYELANEAVVFNMAGAFSPPSNGERVAYADAQEILEFCSKLTPKIILQTHYHPKDFTITMLK